MSDLLFEVHPISEIPCEDIMEDIIEDIRETEEC